jgi:hypothetical protein
MDERRSETYLRDGFHMNPSYSRHRRPTRSPILLPEPIDQDIVRSSIAQLNETSLRDLIERLDPMSCAVDDVRARESFPVHLIELVRFGEVGDGGEVWFDAFAMLLRKWDAYDGETLGYHFR